MENEEFIADLAEALEIEPAEIKEDTPLSDINWDSLAQVSAIALIDQYFEVTVSAKKLEDCRTIGDIFQLIREKGNG